MATKRAGGTKRGGAKKRAASRKRSAPRSAATRDLTEPTAPAAEASTNVAVTVTVLRRGARGPEVEAMQNELVDLGHLRRVQMATGPGVFGPMTEGALRQFQRDNLLEENGTYDAPTQEAVRQINDGVRRGRRGNVVRGLQARLVKLGLMTTGQVASGPGIFGPMTEEALKTFQQHHGILANGVLTDETYQALLRSAPEALPSTAPAAGGATAIDTVLPSEGPGFTHYRREPGGADQFGRAATIRMLMAVGEAWAALGQRPRVQIGDISRRGGGPMPPHAAHQRGVEADIRPVRNDGREEPVRFDDPRYSRELTRELVQVIRRLNPGVTIFFNDPRLVSEGLTRKLVRHDDHLHVRFAV